MFVVRLTWLLLGAVAATPLEFPSLVNEGELTVDGARYVMQIVPSGFSSATQNNIKLLPEVANDNNQHFKAFNSYLEKGVAKKGLTFNIYDDEMRQAAVALFRFLQSIEQNDYETVVNWANDNINTDLLNYAVKLNYLYSLKLNRKILPQVPCYIEKPNFFLNSETIVKALGLRGIMNYPGDLPEESRVHQYYQAHGFIIINTNYSGWNLPHDGGSEEINYFREDIALNCYYLGVHLLHPFWMSNEELDEINPRHAEHYYFTHQQLIARYNLEKEHLKIEGSREKCKDDSYNPYLIYDNGLMFPTRPSVPTDWSDEKAKIKAIDIAIRECISRGFIIMDDGTTVNMTDYNHVTMLAKLIRANLDSVRMAKTVRSLFGYGSNKCGVNENKPAPSILHHPETTLRDPLYWNLIQYVLSYFSELKSMMEPFDISQYETNDFKIVANNFTKIVTYFDYYQFSINKATTDQNHYASKKWPIFAQQRRLKHLPFTLNITVESIEEQNVVVRFFLGPKCKHDCWSDFSKFYEIDSFHFLLQPGINDIMWSPEKSSKYSFFTDESVFDYFNPHSKQSHSKQSSQKKPKYNMYKFPGSLLIPRGIEEGLDLKLFVMLTHAQDTLLMEHAPDMNYYKQVSYEVDSKPLGFPFHREANGYNENANNYKFYDISIYHKRHTVDESGRFSQHLY